MLTENSIAQLPKDDEIVIKDKKLELAFRQEYQPQWVKEMMIMLLTIYPQLTEQFIILLFAFFRKHNVSPYRIAKAINHVVCTSLSSQPSIGVFMSAALKQYTLYSQDDYDRLYWENLRQYGATLAGNMIPLVPLPESLGEFYIHEDDIKEIQQLYAYSVEFNHKQEDQ